MSSSSTHVHTNSQSPPFCDKDSSVSVWFFFLVLCAVVAGGGGIIFGKLTHCWEGTGNAI
jgi:hypothetical protein